MDKDLAKIISGLCIGIAWAYIIFYVLGGFSNIINYGIQIIGLGQLGGLGVLLTVLLVLAPFLISIMLFGIVLKDKK